MGKNNFLRLEEEDMESLPEIPVGIKHNINGQLDGFKTIGNMVDLYLPKFIDMFVAMAGGNVDRSNSSFSHTPKHGHPTEPDNKVSGRPEKRS